MADPEVTAVSGGIVYEDTGGAAPLVYFDIVGAYGTMSGMIELELATRILIPRPDGSTEVKFISCGRLRCSPHAAINLRSGIDSALKLQEPLQPEPPVTAREMN